MQTRRMLAYLQRVKKQPVIVPARGVVSEYGYSEYDLIRNMQEISKDRGRLPVKEEMRVKPILGCFSPYDWYFGSWQNALNISGVAEDIATEWEEEPIDIESLYAKIDEEWAPDSRERAGLTKVLDFYVQNGRAPKCEEIDEICPELLDIEMPNGENVTPQGRILVLSGLYNAYSYQDLMLQIHSRRTTADDWFPNLKDIFCEPEMAPVEAFVLLTRDCPLNNLRGIYTHFSHGLT